MTGSVGCAQRPLDWLDGISEGPVADGIPDQLQNLCGQWLDQKGSLYQLLPATEQSLHVYTTRPSGHRRYTASLVRLVTKRGRSRIIWGANRYTLAHADCNSIVWRGRSDGDAYDWTRIM